MSLERRSASREGGASERLRVAGIGRLTKGLTHLLVAGDAVVIGRHSDCTLVCRTPADASDGSMVSRQHAVVEQQPDGGWCVYDTGSTNGTVVLRGGVPPSIVLSPGTHVPVAAGDVIELAGSTDYQFAIEPAPIEVARPAEPVEGRTERLIASTRASLQILHGGVAIDVIEVDDRGVTLGGGSVSPSAPGARVAIDGLAPEPYATIALQRTDATLRSESRAVQRNLSTITPRGIVPLRDKDLLTFPDAPDVSVLFLDPRQVHERSLSVLLGEADRISIGTAATNSCRLIDPSLSRTHAEIWRENDQLFVKDLNSRNGTTVDGRRVFDTQSIGKSSRLTLGRLPFVADPACWQPSLGTTPAIDVRFAGVSVDIAGKRRLHSVSLGVGHGEMVGLLGPSASGKSTLLKALSGEQRTAGGEMYVNGRPLRKNEGRWNWFSSLMGYQGEAYEVGFVQQIDLIQPDLTVREVLEYAARHMGIGGTAARQRATDAGEMCNLGPLMDRVALLGNGKMNLSGGQLKRVCVAMEILRQPRILLLDEPTTGQDPKNTDDLMKLFRSVAQSGVTLMMSTHDLRNLVVFDKVAALCLGRLVYYGPPTSFASYFGAQSAEEVYESLPDREERQAESEALAERFRATPLYRQYCEVPE
jgi:ABC-type multidrug transport system ATPase subunit/pSer/pThr/pTyr-binding forkhead associated (FHA) protein